MTGPRDSRQRLKGLSEPELLEELVARYRAALADEGIPGRLLRRGFGHVTVEIHVRDFELSGVDVGCRTSALR